MTTLNVLTRCFTCKEETTTHSCPGCSKQFCEDDLMKHREELKSQFVQMLNDQQKSIPNNHPSIIQINLWEQKSIEKIKQTAEEQRQIVQQSIHRQFNNFTEQMQQINKRQDFNEIDLQNLQIQLEQLQQQINQPTNIQIKQDSSTTFISKLSIQILHSSDQTTLYHRHQLKSNIKWKSNAQTIAGGNGRGDQLNQLLYPQGIYVDYQQQHIYITDLGNHRILKWKLDEHEGQIVAGGNRQGSRIDQLNEPSDVIVDERNKSLIMCDFENRRVVRWSLENPNDKEILIENILCWGLVMNENGDLFVSDFENHAVKRWRKGEKGTIMAGGNGKGNRLNQLNCPTYIFIDRDETIYVSDWGNHRVMKWLKDASEGIIVAGGQGQGNNFNELNHPRGLLVNEIGDIYVADGGNNRIMYWPLRSKEGHVVAGGNGKGERSNQLNYPVGLAFDAENNLYVVDEGNNRVQRFAVDKN